jgi:hypothetical protein
MISATPHDVIHVILCFCCCVAIAYNDVDDVDDDDEGCFCGNFTAAAATFFYERVY